MSIMICLYCSNEVKQDHYGLHEKCFREIFDMSSTETFEDLSRKNATSFFGKKESPYLSSYFAGQFKKYDARLGGKRYILKVLEEKAPELVGVEYFCNCLAKIFGIPVPEPFCILNFHEGLSFVEKNFMSESNVPLNLIHIYHFLEPGEENFNVEHILDLIRRETNSILNVELFLTVVLFDALVGNHDRHGRNLALIDSPKGKKLSPIYDNVSYLGLEKEDMLKASFNPKGKIFTKDSVEPSMSDYVKEIRRLNYLKVLENFGKRINKENIKLMIDKSPVLSKNMREALWRLMERRIDEFFSA